MELLLQALKNYLPVFDQRQKQTNNIIFITFWSQFAAYGLSTILILFLTRPVLTQGLGYTQAQAYTFMGVASAVGYLMPILGGFMADTVVGIRRSILLGSILVASAYLLLMLSSYSVGVWGDRLFIAAYAVIPVTNSLLMGTSSSMVSHIYADDAVKAKSAMTFYYMAINIGALISTFISPMLFDSRYGPLSVLALCFAGKSLAALNFAQRYSLYDPIVWGKDAGAFLKNDKLKLLSYLLLCYLGTVLALLHVNSANWIIGIGCAVGILWFLIQTLGLKDEARNKQMIAAILIMEAIIFFVIYNQMNTTLVLFAKNNSDLLLFGFSISPAQYQMLNPLLILLIGFQLPRFYRYFSGFSIPYQFASGTMLAGMGLLIMGLACYRASNGIVHGNYIAFTYILISLAELWVSAIGLSMIGLYCDQKNIAFAMGVWYLSCSMSNIISGRLAQFVAFPNTGTPPTTSIVYYKNFYLGMGCSALVVGAAMLVIAYYLHKIMRQRGIELF